jgi:DNA-binding Xre family transcriptional regulator
MTDIKHTVAKNTEFFMHQQGMSIDGLQEITGFSVGTLNSVLSGKGVRGITIGTLAVLANALDVPPGDIVDDWRD